MSIRSPRALILVATAALLTVVAPFVLAPEPAAPSQTGPGVQLLDEARRAAQEQDFSGVLEVTWSDAAGEHNNDVFVRSAGGVLALGDRPSVIVEGARRFVQGPDGWLAVWSQATQPDVPPALDKWELSVHDGPLLVRGRDSHSRVTNPASRNDTGRMTHTRAHLTDCNCACSRLVSNLFRAALHCMDFAQEER